jgi:hypothetical protein
MTVVKWYEPIDPWMHELIASDLTRYAQSLEDCIIAAFAASVIWRAKKIEPDYQQYLTMYTLEQIVRKLIPLSDYLRERARQSPSFVVDLSEPEDSYGYAMGPLMCKARDVAEEAIKHFTESMSGVSCSDIIGFFNQRLDQKD